MSDCRHDFQPAPPAIHVGVFRDEIKIPRPGVFVCSTCGLEVSTNGALEQPRDARDDSYRPDLPLRSSDASTAAWADRVRAEDER